LAIVGGGLLYLGDDGMTTDDRWTWNDLGEQIDSLKEKKKLDDFRLTNRQKTLVHSLARGLTNRQIADEQGISENTVERNMLTLFNKFGVRNRQQLPLIVAAIFPDEFFDEEGELTSGSAIMPE
jgi:DNA-binding NarL/FixJ family response regulator